MELSISINRLIGAWINGVIYLWLTLIRGRKSVYLIMLFIIVCEEICGDLMLVLVKS
jgi:hypothetical protein